jgi:hypothetical protein
MFGNKKAAPTEPSPRCELCGLDAPGEAFVLYIRGRRLRFCCDGCRGIYCLLNGIETLPGSDVPNE